MGETYHIWFTFYRYNTGMADNGTFSRKIVFNSLEEATHAKWMIEAYIKGTLSTGNKEKLEEEYLGGRCNGFFESFDGIYKVHSYAERVD
jgi:hypothetical protein